MSGSFSGGPSRRPCFVRAGMRCPLSGGGTIILRGCRRGLLVSLRGRRGIGVGLFGAVGGSRRHVGHIPLRGRRFLGGGGMIILRGCRRGLLVSLRRRLRPGNGTGLWRRRRGIGVGRITLRGWRRMPPRLGGSGRRIGDRAAVSGILWHRWRAGRSGAGLRIRKGSVGALRKRSRWGIRCFRTRRRAWILARKEGRRPAWRIRRCRSVPRRVLRRVLMRKCLLRVQLCFFSRPSLGLSLRRGRGSSVVP